MLCFFFVFIVADFIAERDVIAVCGTSLITLGRIEVGCCHLEPSERMNSLWSPLCGDGLVSLVVRLPTMIGCCVIWVFSEAERQRLQLCFVIDPGVFDLRNHGGLMQPVRGCCLLFAVCCFAVCCLPFVVLPWYSGDTVCHVVDLGDDSDAPGSAG